MATASWIVLVVTGGLALAALVRVARCPHVDDEGRSLLSWTWREGRVRGYCWRCHRQTSGWVNPGRQGDRVPCARVATPDDVIRSRARLQARRRLAQRMRLGARGVEGGAA